MTLERLLVVIQVQTQGLTQQISGIKQQFSGLEAAVGRTSSSISAMFAGMGKAALAAISVKALLTVGKQAVNVASDLQEVQNVVDTAFGSMSKDVDKWAKTTIDRFGMSELAAKRTASTYMAMSNGLGLAGKEAADMSIQVAERTADIASFYNVTQEVADTALKSIWTGETESLKRFGVVMTQANLDAYALAKGIRKTTNEMTQAEQVQLRYQYVMEKTSQAAGDFEKTSGSWANQIRLLSERFKELLGILGAGLIQILTPVVKMLNTLLGVIVKIASFIGDVLNFIFGGFFGNGSQGNTGQIQTGLEGTAGAMDDLAGSTESVKKALTGVLSGFDELNVLNRGLDVFGTDAEGGGTQSPVTPGTGGGDETDKVPVIDYTGAEKAAERIEKAFDRIMKHPITKWLKGDGSKAWDTYLRHTENWYKYIQENKETLNELLDALEAYSEQLGVAVGWMADGAWTDFPGVLEQVQSAVLNLSKSVLVLSDSLSALGSTLSACRDQTFRMVSSMSTIMDSMDITGAYARGPFVSAIVSTFLIVQDTFARIRMVLQETFGHIGDTFAFLTSGVLFPLQFAFSHVFSGISGIIVKFKHNLSELLGFVSGVFAEGWTRAWEGIKKYYSWIWTEMWLLVRYPINMIIFSLNTLWSAVYAIVSGIVNGAGGILEWLGDRVGQDWSFSMPAEPPLIPYLASGGVAYGPTLAMIGEGNDREAVLPLNQSVFSEIARGINANSDPVVVILLEQLLEAVRQIDPNIVMDGQTLAVKSSGYYDAEQRRRGSSVVKVV